MLRFLFEGTATTLLGALTRNQALGSASPAWAESVLTFIKSTNLLRILALLCPNLNFTKQLCEANLNSLFLIFELIICQFLIIYFRFN
jgi:hypothetical protein